RRSRGPGRGRPRSRPRGSEPSGCRSTGRRDPGRRPRRRHHVGGRPRRGLEWLAWTSEAKDAQRGMSSDANGLQSPSPTSKVRVVMTLCSPIARLGVVCSLLSIAILAAAGCGDPNKPPATIPITYDTLVAYSLATAEPTQPTAFDLATSQLMIPDGSL